MAAYGYVYRLSATAQIVTVGSAVLFDNNGPLVNESLNVNGEVTMTLSGDYQIIYSISKTSATATSRIAIAVNGQTIDTTVVQNGDADDGQVIGNAILKFAAGDKITLINVGTASFPLAVMPIVAAQLTINKLN